ncbi:MAG: oligosaccharide flippase family protein, partial [Actinobacteria bacterium]|nr:oligosaccharide flippase family protein [Actinomycetota bacterium]
VLLFIAINIVNFSNYIYTLMMARMLGPAEFSLFASLISIFIILSSLISTIQTVTTKYISNFFAEKDYKSISNFFFDSFKKIILICLIVFLFFILASKQIALFLNTVSPIPIIILGSMVIISIFVSISRGTLQGLQSFSHLSLNLIIDAILRLVIGISLVYLGFKTSGAIGSSSISGFLAILISFIPLSFIFKSRNNKQDIKQDINFLEVYKYSIPVLIASICIFILISFDLVLVKHFFNELNAGQYSAAATMGKIVIFIPGAIGLVMFPKVAEYHKKNVNSIDILKKSLFITLILCGGVTICYFLFPNFLIRIMFGKIYENSAYLIKFFGVAMTFFALNNILILYNLSIEKFKFIFPTIFFTILQIVLIYLFHGSLIQVILILLFNSLVLFAVNLISTFL